MGGGVVARARPPARPPVQKTHNRHHGGGPPASPLLDDWVAGYDGVHPIADVGAAYGLAQESPLWIPEVRTVPSEYLHRVKNGGRTRRKGFPVIYCIATPASLQTRMAKLFSSVDAWGWGPVAQL